MDPDSHCIVCRLGGSFAMETLLMIIPAGAADDLMLFKKENAV